MTKNDIKTARKQAQIWQVAITSTNKKRVLAFFREKLAGTRQKAPFFVATTNPEMVMLASNDPKYARILNSADISLPDGIGLVQAVRFWELSTPRNKLLKPVTVFLQGVTVGLATIFNRAWLTQDLAPIKGREMFLDLMKLANKKKWKVFFFGGVDGEAEEAAEKLRGSLKSVEIKALDGPKLDEEGRAVGEEEKRIEKRAIATINAFHPDILFLAFTPPKQEKWFAANKKNLKVGGVMGVGGTFRYVTGRSAPPPNWMGDMGLEWIWRLVTEPRRIGRILTAFPLFPLKVFISKLKN